MFGISTIWLKIGLVIAIVIAGYFAINRIVQYVDQAARNEVIIADQRQALRMKEKEVMQLQLDAIAKEVAIEERDAEIEKLQEDLTGLVENLGPDEDQLAPESTRALIERIFQLENSQPPSP